MLGGGLYQSSGSGSGCNASRCVIGGQGQGVVFRSGQGEGVLLGGIEVCQSNSVSSQWPRLGCVCLGVG